MKRKRILVNVFSSVNDLPETAPCKIRSTEEIFEKREVNKRQKSRLIAALLR
jgi:hypothetical protein